MSGKEKEPSLRTSSFKTTAKAKQIVYTAIEKFFPNKFEKQRQKYTFGLS